MIELQDGPERSLHAILAIRWIGSQAPWHIGVLSMSVQCHLPITMTYEMASSNCSGNQKKANMTIAFSYKASMNVVLSSWPANTVILVMFNYVWQGQGGGARLLAAHHTLGVDCMTQCSMTAVSLKQLVETKSKMAAWLILGLERPSSLSWVIFSGNHIKWTCFANFTFQQWWIWDISNHFDQAAKGYHSFWDMSNIP